MSEALDKLRAESAARPTRKTICTCGKAVEVSVQVQIRERDGRKALKTSSRVLCADCAVKILDLVKAES